MTLPFAVGVGMVFPSQQASRRAPSKRGKLNRKEGWRRIYLLTAGIWSSIFLVLAIWGYLTADSSREYNDAAAFLLLTIVPPIFGYVLLFYTGPIVRWIREGFRT